MAEMAVSLAIQQLLPLLRKEANLLRGIHKEFAYIKDELESIQAFLKDAEKRAAVEGDNVREGVKIWVKQVIGVAFRIEDITDEYMIYEPRKPRHPKYPDSLHKIVQLIKTLIPRHRIGSEIREIKSSVCMIKERSDRYGFQIQPQESSGIQNAKWYDPRLVHMEEIDVVRFQESREILIGWLVKGRVERTVVSVVGKGGQGDKCLKVMYFI
jgi:disease resistance protein RPM1